MKQNQNKPSMTAMRSIPFNCRPGSFLKRKTTPVFWAVGLCLLLLVGCADEKVDEGANCRAQLDNREFQTVADNAACSNYERGSAEMGLGGFLFENFVKDDANTNFPSVLNLTATGCATAGTDALVGTYASTYQSHFLRAQYWTRTKPQTDGATRSNEEIEISFFSSLAEIIAHTYCEIDSNLNGTITATENQSFTKINIGSASVGTSNLDSATGLFQIVDSGIPWLCDSGLGSCRRDNTYEGVWDNADASTTTNYNTLIASSGISAVNVIVKVESLQQLFDPTATSTEITRPYNFLSVYTTRAALLMADLTSLGIATDDDLYKNVSESVGKMDNGGTCTSSSAQVLDLLTTIVQHAPPYSTAASLPSTKYQTYNLLTVGDVTQIDTGESTLTCSFCSAGVPFKARLIYKAGSTYTGLYKTADSGIKNTLSNLATLTLDSSNNLIPVVKDDEKIALKELLCLDN
ncbi:MAG: hypothetical protein ABIK68_01000 [bacterium]